MQVTGLLASPATRRGMDRTDTAFLVHGHLLPSASNTQLTPQSCATSISHSLPTTQDIDISEYEDPKQALPASILDPNFLVAASV